MKRNIIIDYINVSSFVKLIVNERGSNVISLFRPHSKIIEFFLIKILGLFGIEYSLKKIILDRYSDTMPEKIFDRTEAIELSLSNDYIYNSDSKINDAFNFRIKNWFFCSLWRQVFIIDYVQRLNINVDAIYIASQVSNKLLLKSHFYQSELNKGHLIHYKTSSLMADEDYAYSKIRPKIKYVGTKISSLLVFFYSFLFVRFTRKTSITPIDLLIFGHNDAYKWLSLDEIIDNSSFNSKVIYPNGIAGAGKDKFHIRSIYWRDIFLFYSHMFSGVLRFYWAAKISIDLYSDLLSRWKYIYILQSLFTKYEVKIILSSHEAPISQMALAVAADNSKIVSLDSVWSIGFRPTEIAYTQNSQSDRYFLWGSWHHDLMMKSNDKSRGHIVAGYIGDAYIPLMKSSGKKFRDQQLNIFDRIITVFDSGSSEDRVPEIIYFDYLKAIILIAEEFNALVVLKVKNTNRYSEFIKSLNTERLVLHFEKGSLATALNSDVVTGVVNASLASITAVYGRQVIFYDPNKMIWDKWYSYKNSCLVVRSLPELQNFLRDHLVNEAPKVVPSPKYIDPYGDGKAQFRMQNYIQNIFDNFHLGKNKAMDIADNMYKTQWGDDKLIIKEDFNKELNEKNKIRKSS